MGALVLTRTKGQEVYSDAGGTRITVRIAEIRGDRIRLAFEAPAEVVINRREIADAQERSGKSR